MGVGGSGRVGSDFLSAMAGRVGPMFHLDLVGSGPRKVTRGQLCVHIAEVSPSPQLNTAVEFVV